MVPAACAPGFAGLPYWNRFTAPGISASRDWTRCSRAVSRSPLTGSGSETRSTSPPSARIDAMAVALVRESTTHSKRTPYEVQTRARATPRLPELDSTTVPPGARRPLSRASRTIASAGRSLVLPPGLTDSSLARISTPESGKRRSRRTSGVPPIAAERPTATPAPEAVRTFSRRSSRDGRAVDADTPLTLRHRGAVRAGWTDGSVGETQRADGALARPGPGRSRSAGQRDPDQQLGEEEPGQEVQPQEAPPAAVRLLRAGIGKRPGRPDADRRSVGWGRGGAGGRGRVVIDGER